MNAISTFTFHESNIIRVQLIDGEPWFCLRDVCNVLNLNTRSSNSFGLDEKGVQKFCTPSNGGNQELTFVNEPNLYRVIFRSNKTQAKQFQDWVFNEVLPSIRKTGKYETPSVKDDKDYLTTKDMDVLKKLVWRCCDYVQVKDRPFEKFSYAIWECLRQVTGVRSTDKFEAKHLPIIANEMHRILSVLELYLKRANRTEAKIIKLMLRQRINTESIIDECMADITFSDEQIHNELLHIESLPLSFECRQLIR